MDFLIQNTQDRDSIALHLKMDELIRAIERADDSLIEAEDESEHELSRRKAEFRRIDESEWHAIQRTRPSNDNEPPIPTRTEQPAK